MTDTIAKRFALAIATATLLLTMAGPATAEPPRLARVEGLPRGDTLTVRAEPTSKSQALGALAEGAGPIEILATTTTGSTEWARISVSEGDGWVARRYLAATEVERIGETSLTIGLVCGGTEPFWGLDLIGERQALWRDPELGKPAPVRIDEPLSAVARGGWPAALMLSSGRFEAALTAIPTECSDGMSDRTYPWTALLLDMTGDRPRLFEGCCGHRVEMSPR